ncbi:MAG: hypothetical protein E7042_07515 [Lentisphaerae bacterium]|nr:hypothetical protein [Lentisphaerota bacterium]
MEIKLCFLNLKNSRVILKYNRPEGMNMIKKAGLFVDDGCRNCGVLQWARLLHYSPQFELSLLEAEDICNGSLDELDLFICPGGGSARQLRAMQESGQKAVKRFIENGGAYLGICAGCYNILNNPDRLQLLPFEFFNCGCGGTAVLTVEINNAGAAIMDITPGNYEVRYSDGPLMKFSDNFCPGTGEVLAVYRNSVSGAGQSECYDFNGVPAMICGRYGKGRIVGISFHPESNESSYPIAIGALYAAAGVKAIPNFPQTIKRPWRVGFVGRAIIGRTPVLEMFDLESHPDIDLQLIAAPEINAGILRHLDLVVLPHGVPESYKVFFTPQIIESLTGFMERGGKIFTSGNASGFLKNHANLKILPPATRFYPEIFA